MIIGIDPGNVYSAYCIVDEKNNLIPIEFGKILNDELLEIIYTINKWNKIYREKKVENIEHFAIEMVSNYGMTVGATIFETVFFSGILWEACKAINKTKIYRKEVKLNLCKNLKTKDKDIRNALIKRFGDVGTKKEPGWFYGFKEDIWSAYAIAVTYYDLYLNIKGEKLYEKINGNSKKA